MGLPLKRNRTLAVTLEESIDRSARLEDFPAFARRVIQSRLRADREDPSTVAALSFVLSRAGKSSLTCYVLPDAMSMLSSEEYSALMLRHRAEMSQLDISVSLGISPATVSRVLASAERRFVRAAIALRIKV